MKETWSIVKVETTGRVALVLDASTSSRQQWQDISHLTQELLSTLPQAVQQRIYFLGNPQPHPASDFVRQGRRWYQDNRRRVSLISPIFEGLEKDAETTIVVLSASRLFDVEDWQGTQVLERTLFVRFGDVPLTNGLCQEWKPSLEQLQSQLHNPVARVEISGRGAMPFFWDNDAYQWDGAQLVAERAPDFTVRVGFLCALDEEKVRAIATLTNGEVRDVAFHPCKPPQSTDWRPLSLQESEVFRQCVREGQYRCPFCQQEHVASEVRCSEGSILGTSVYPTLERWCGRGFVLLRDFGQQVKYHPHPYMALRIGNDAVAIRSGGRADIYRFQPASCEWRKSDQSLKQYQPMDDDTYAIVL